MKSTTPHTARLFRVLCIVSGLAASSCSSTVKVDQDVVDGNYQKQPRRILVFGTLDQDFSLAAANQFPGAMQRSMARCGVQTQVYAPTGLQLNPAERLKTMINAFNPDSVLLIRQSVKNIYNGWVQSGTYVLTLKDVSSGHDVWTAAMRLFGPAPIVSDRSTAGTAFADQIVDRLAADNVLKHCVPAVVTGTAG